MRISTKIVTGVAAFTLAFGGVAATTGVANAAPLPLPLPSDISIPGLGGVTLTGTVVKIDGKYITITLDASGRKVVIEREELTRVIGDLKQHAKIQVVVSELEALLAVVKAKLIAVLG